jgi:uncharacterized protein YecT (DUF1311 family)
MKKVKRQSRFAFFICDSSDNNHKHQHGKTTDLMIPRSQIHMPIPVLVAIAVLFSISAPLVAAENTPDAEQLIAQCEQKIGKNRFHLHRCLLSEYEQLVKETDHLTDKLLGLVGAHRSFGRMKIIQWSSAITKSQSRWQKLVPHDCEWEGHILANAKGAAVAIDRCGIKRAAQRVKFLKKRVKDLVKVVNTAKEERK